MKCWLVLYKVLVEIFQSREDNLLGVAYQIIFLTVWFTIEGVEWFALQVHRAMMTGETRDMVDLFHCCTAAILSDDFFAAFDANTCKYS